MQRHILDKLIQRQRDEEYFRLAVVFLVTLNIPAFFLICLYLW